MLDTEFFAELITTETAALALSTIRLFCSDEWLPGSGESLSQDDQVVREHGTVYIGLEMHKPFPVAAR